MKKLFIACGLYALAATAVYAQTGAAQVQGIVSDASGAVIPNADVTLENPQTSSKFDTKTNGSGLYIFPSLRTGDYKVSIPVPGLERWEAQITLRAGQLAELNATLKVAQSTEQVTVVG